MDQPISGSRGFQPAGPDPLMLVPRIMSRLHTYWLRWTYPFHSVGKNFYAHYSSDIRREVVRHMQIGNSVFVDREVWLNIPTFCEESGPVLILQDGVGIGRRCMISAKNLVSIGRDTIFGPSVLVTDHLHAFEDIDLSIAAQGVTHGGTVRIEEECWIGYGAAIVGNQGDLVIGKHSVIGANSVVTRSVPPYSVVAGNPGRVVKQFDPEKDAWVLGQRMERAKSARD